MRGIEAPCEDLNSRQQPVSESVLLVERSIPFGSVRHVVRSSFQLSVLICALLEVAEQLSLVATKRRQITGLQSALGDVVMAFKVRAELLNSFRAALRGTCLCIKASLGVVAGRQR